MSTCASKSRSQNGAPYVYQPLARDKSETRLLHLLPGIWTAPIRVKLSVIDLDEKQSLAAYEALSYAWGEQSKKENVVVVDGRHCWNLPVTSNAELALRYLRRERGGRRTLWVDAICINQTDIQERGSQVASMVDIYYSAQRTLVWLGAADHQTAKAMRYIRSIGTKDYGSPSSLRRRMGPKMIRSIFDLTRRSWFERLWIWQEVMGTTQHPLLMCGHEHMSWLTFRMATASMFGNLHTSAEALIYHEITGAIPLAALEHFTSHMVGLTGSHGISADPIENLNNQRMCLTSDARDRVYTAQNLAMLANSTSYWIQPDYSRSAQEVFTAFIMNYVRISGRLDYLEHQRTPMLDGLPSWVPDWSSNLPRLVSPSGRASGPSKSDAVVLDSLHLSIRGLIIDHIEHVVKWNQQVIRVLNEDCGSTTVVKLLGNLKDDIQSSADAAQALRLLDAETVISEISAAIFLRNTYKQHLALECEKYWAGVQKGEVALRKLLSCDYPGDLDPRTVMLLAGTWLTTEGRLLMRTRSGRFYLCPATARDGDVLAVVLGCATVLVMRPTQCGHYMIVGNAYGRACADAEALLGPLPKAYEAVLALEEFRDGFRNGSKHGLRHGFGHKETGKFQWLDPRLMALPLPENWLIEIDSDAPLKTTFRNIVTGEVRNWDQDPRCDAYELERRGVKLQTFELV